jgi:uncharacterized UBP type Zn finger protein
VMGLSQIPGNHYVCFVTRVIATADEKYNWHLKNDDHSLSSG